MARKTLDERILALETQIENIQASLDEQESFRSLTAQGNQGATTEFVDPKKLYDRIDQLNNRLSVLYKIKG